MTEKKVSGFDKYKNLVLLVAVLWVILFISFLLPINRFGIMPRTLFGLTGIFTSPFLHDGIIHLAANSTGILILGFLFINLENKNFLIIAILLVLLSGFGTWLIGRSGYIHIGASGVIYGLIGYLVSAGIFKRNVKSIVISLIVFFLYGGAIIGIFPSDAYISWESHLSGLLSGIILAGKFK